MIIIFHVTLKKQRYQYSAQTIYPLKNMKCLASMETQGNKSYLLRNIHAPNKGEYTDYDIPPDALTDPDFVALIKEAEKYLGYPMYGVSSPYFLIAQALYVGY